MDVARARTAPQWFAGAAASVAGAMVLLGYALSRRAPDACVTRAGWTGAAWAAVLATALMLTAVALAGVGLRRAYGLWAVPGALLLGIAVVGLLCAGYFGAYGAFESTAFAQGCG
jgi:hypothetical protein